MRVIVWLLPHRQFNRLTPHDITKTNVLLPIFYAVHSFRVFYFLVFLFFLCSFYLFILLLFHLTHLHGIASYCRIWAATSSNNAPPLTSIVWEISGCGGAVWWNNLPKYEIMPPGVLLMVILWPIVWLRLVLYHLLQWN